MNTSLYIQKARHSAPVSSGCQAADQGGSRCTSL